MRSLRSRFSSRAQPLSAKSNRTYALGRFQRNANRFPSSHLHLRSIAIIGRIEDNNLLTLIHQSDNAAEQTLNSSVDSDNAILVIEDSKTLLVKLCNCLGIVQ
jgi:hypothetical protein